MKHFLWVATLLLIAGIPLKPPKAACATETASAVRFEVLENIPDKKSWDFEHPPATEEFEQPWMAMEELPQRYNDRGVRADRSNPFVLRGVMPITLPKGPWRFLLRSHGAARLYIDDKIVAEVGFPARRSDGHDTVFHYQPFDLPGTRMARASDRQALGKFDGDDAVHQLRLEVIVGGQKRRPEVGELSVSMARPEEPLQVVAADGRAVPLTDAGWSEWQREWRDFLDRSNAQRRRAAMEIDAAYWNRRHDAAREYVNDLPPLTAANVSDDDRPANPIDRWINAALKQAGVEPGPLVDDAGFLRRLSLDVRGIIPTAEESAAFLAETQPDKRARTIDRFLEDPRWADHWVAYWQDVLAENPNLVNPTLNNTGPFRWWIYESYLDNKPMDRFATELVMMEGSRYFGGPAGFGMATENDVPMAAKAHIVGRALLGMEMGCARCHDAPLHHFSQKDLFSLAAMLKRAPEPVPATSTIQRTAEELAKLSVEITLKPGEKVPPEWPFAKELPSALHDDWIRNPRDSREKLAALVTSPHNSRFAKVLVNRLWERYFGRGLVENLDDWEDADCSHPELLEYLARELMAHRYDLKHVARQILNSQCYQRAVVPSPAKPELFAVAIRRRMTAEQLLDSLFHMAGKPFDVEPMNIDVDASRTYDLSLNLGRVERAWQFSSLSNDRDRPSLQLPFAQQLTEALETFGWRGERQNPLSVRAAEPMSLQPAILANGVAARRATQLSDSGELTQLALEEISPEQLVEQIFLRALSRYPLPEERDAFAALLSAGFSQRREVSGQEVASDDERPLAEVSWSSHVHPEATIVKQQLSRLAERGDPPTRKLVGAWREQMEDAIWALVNTPEFIFLP